MSGNTVNPLELSDEDFFKLPMPDDAPAAAASEDNSGAEGGAAATVVEVETPPTKTAEEIAADEAAAAAAAAAAESGAAKPDGEAEPAKADPAPEGEGGGDKPGAEGAEGGAAQPAAKEGEKPGEAEAKPAEGAVPAAGSKPEGQAEAAAQPVNHEDFYKKVMAPFVANGKTIELNTPEEVIQLMQQGANYTRKMQAIAPHRKMLTMAQNNGITEDKLSFLIDLEKGNPEAIQKFLKDKGVDPLTIDTDAEPTYREGTHKVSDNEVAFQTNLEELGSTPEGKETLQTINSTWDDASKEVLWGEPGLMPVIHAQKANGIYDRIVSEVDRRKMLGQITPETSFITAYRTVGDDLFKSGGFDDLAPKPAPAVVPPVKTAVATTAAAPAAVVDNGDKASAASPTRSTPKPAKTNINPLAMSDAEFEANFASMQGRV